MLRREPSILHNCSELSDQAQSKFAAQETTSSDHADCGQAETASEGYLGLETQCKIFSVRRI